MRITILTFGSRGAVQPLIALGRGLQAARHRVRLATHAPFEDFVRGRGLDFAPVGDRPRQLIQQQMKTGSLPARLARRAGRLLQKSPPLEPLMKRFLDEAWAACQGSDAIVYSVLGMAAGYSIAEKLGVPCCLATNQPWSPTRAFPSSLAPAGPALLDGVYNRLTYTAEKWFYWRLYRPAVSQWRAATLGLPPLADIPPYRHLAGRPVPFLYNYSPSLLPRPADWPAQVHVTGYSFLERPADWQPPPDLVDFLAAGPPPVYIGFGSMIDPQPEAMTGMVLDALRRTGLRAILLTGWGGLQPADLPASMFMIDDIPHDWLFPQMAAVMHHGGSGSTATGLRAGVPSIVVPYFGDQFFWGERVGRLRVGPPPIPRRRVTADRLAEALRVAADDPAVRDRAAALGRRIEAEDGVARSVEIVNRHLGPG